MKIALIGYGKMGKLIEEIAQKRGYSIVAKIHPTSSTPVISFQNLKDAEVCIDFSHPSVAMDHIKQLASLKKNIIMGTTGWLEHLETVKTIVKENQIGFLYSPNFSIGVQLFLKIVKEAARLINPFEEYDVGGYELHHQHKADSPSGTAEAIVKVLLGQIDRKDTSLFTSLKGPIAKNELHFSSLRCGSIPGTHTVVFDSPADSITLTHQARNREGFATGALVAAEWLKDKQGFFTLDDFMENIR